MPTTALPSDASTGVVVRPFRRDDRDQLTALVNAHVAAVVPGVTLSVHSVLAQLEGEPGEILVDPWVAVRRTLVAVQRGRVVAAAHLVVNRGDDDVPAGPRGRAEVRWLLCWPDAPYWPDAGAAGLALARALTSLLRDRPVSGVVVDTALPAPGVYGTPEQWPHVSALLEAVGFVRRARREHVLLATTDALPRRPVPLPGLHVRRTVGANGTRFAAVLDGAGGSAGSQVGVVEVEVRPTDLSRTSSPGGWSEVGELEVDAQHRRRGVARWLLGEAAAWLRLGHVDRVLASCDADGRDGTDQLAVAEAVGFVRLTTTVRQWELPPAAGPRPGATMAP